MADIKPMTGATQMIAATALRAQQARMRVIAENMANAQSVSRQPGGDPYRRQVPVFTPYQTNAGQGVRVARVEPDRKDFRSVYDPSHPAADDKGYVKLPNVDTLVEALDMKEAQRAYEANLNVIETARALEQRTPGLLKK